MNNPPPLPALNAIKPEIFYGQTGGGLRLNPAKSLIERIADAHRKAQEWLARRPDIEIISISNGSAASGDVANAVFVTVWYRERA
jgi:hypothetical protein